VDIHVQLSFFQTTSKFMLGQLQSLQHTSNLLKCLETSLTNTYHTTTTTSKTSAETSGATATATPAEATIIVSVDVAGATTTATIASADVVVSIEVAGATATATPVEALISVSVEAACATATATPADASVVVSANTAGATATATAAEATAFAPPSPHIVEATVRELIPWVIEHTVAHRAISETVVPQWVILERGVSRWRVQETATLGPWRVIEVEL
jgi:hypothetical protein